MHYSTKANISNISNIDTLTIKYGLDQQRLYQTTTLENGTTKEKYFIGGLYEKQISDGNIKELCYISTPAGTVAIKQTENNNDTWLFLTHDHLGSVHCILNEEGNLQQELSFDPYGNRRNPNTWKPFEEGLEPTYLLDRGYTFHEHWDDFSLINMNGRVYDPVIARFLSPDPYVQSPSCSQNFNRYSYVLNNPMKFTDPSGEFIMAMYTGVAFMGEFTSNLINSKHDPLGNAWTSATELTSDMNSVGQFPIYKKGNLTVTAGYSAFDVGFSVNASYSDGQGFNYGASVGYGIGNGLNAALWMNYSSGNWSGSIFSGYSGGNGINVGAGATYHGDNWSAGYYYTYHGDSGKTGAQYLGGLSFSHGDFSFRIENDFFAWKGEDRWRSSALEFGFGDVIIGSNILTSDPKNDNIPELDKVIRPGYSLSGRENKRGKGTWKYGYVYSAPLYIGIKSNGRASRIGYSHRKIQDATQNMIHRVFKPGSQHYYLNYKHMYEGGWGSEGYYNPYSLY